MHDPSSIPTRPHRAGALASVDRRGDGGSEGFVQAMNDIPSAYKAGHLRASAIDRRLADIYVRHTQIGDPAADAAVKDLAELPRPMSARFIQAGMDQNEDVLRDAPQSLRDVFAEPEPPWLDHAAFIPGGRAFQANVFNIFAAFVAGTLIDGFSTLISESFVQTGRIFDNGVARLRQNNRHQVEILWPDGLQRYGDGWKLSVRIRFIHAQIRRLLSQSPEWDFEAHGTPISAAHMGFALACFSARTLKHSTTLGATYSKQERESFCAVWRYAGHLMGVPDAILYTNEENALRWYDIGSACEPAPTDNAVITSNALINSAPLVAGITDPDTRADLVRNTIYPVSRLLVGNDLADALNIPKSGMIRVRAALLQFRLNNVLRRFMERVTGRGGSSLVAAFGASLYDNAGLRYDMPDHAHSEESSSW